MPSTFHNDGGVLWAEQPAGSSLDYTLDWSSALAPGDSISESAWAADTGISVGDHSAAPRSATVWLSGGVAGRSYGVTNSIRTVAGRRDAKQFRVFIRGVAASGPPSVFGDAAGAVAELRRDRLLSVAQNWLPDVELSDGYLAGKLLAAEMQAQRALRAFLTPREVYATGTKESDIAALRAAGHAVVEEPGYDYDPRLFARGTWGALALRHRPVIKVHGLTFVYGPGDASLYGVPPDWLRVDKRYGRVQFVPTGTYMAGQLGGFVLSAAGFARAMPLAMRVRYRAGLEDAAGQYPDLLDTIKKMAVLEVINDQFLPASGSTSADGLSESLSWDAGKYQDAIDHKLERLRQSIGGITMGCL